MWIAERTGEEVVLRQATTSEIINAMLSRGVYRLRKVTHGFNLSWMVCDNNHPPGLDEEGAFSVYVPPAHWYQLFELLILNNPKDPRLKEYKAIYSVALLWREIIQGLAGRAIWQSEQDCSQVAELIKEGKVKDAYAVIEMREVSRKINNCVSVGELKQLYAQIQNPDRYKDLFTTRKKEIRAMLAQIERHAVTEYLERTR